MTELPFDLADPPDDPPTDAVLPMLWRVAVRLHRDHGVPEPSVGGVPGCARCGQDWPCLGRRLAQRGLVAACRTTGWSA